MWNKVITNKEDWWKSVDDNWIDLLNVIDRFLDLSNNPYSDDLPCSGEMIDFGVQWRPKYGKSSDDQKTLKDKIIELKDKRDLRLADIFEITWEAAPDDTQLHSIPGWSLMCDLSSDSYLIKQELPENDPCAHCKLCDGDSSESDT